MEKPKYVKCIKVWKGNNGNSVLDEVYDTDIPNTFSCYSWKELLNGAGASQYKDYFIEISKEEYYKAKGLELSINNYQIY